MTAQFPSLQQLAHTLCRTARASVLLSTAAVTLATPSASAQMPVPCQLTVEFDAGSQVLRVRGHNAPPEVCPIPDFLAELRKALEALPPESRLESVYIGRLAAYPPWSRQLAMSAAADPQWNKKTGRAKSGNDNKSVGKLLEQPVVLSADLMNTMASLGYAAAGVSVEKVLVAPATEIGLDPARYKGLLPYDAMVWIRVEAKTGR